MAARQARALPKSMRNPIDALEMAFVLKDGANVMEQEAAQNNRTERSRPAIMRIRAFANELEEWANAKIGDHEKRLQG